MGKPEGYYAKSKARAAAASSPAARAARSEPSTPSEFGREVLDLADSLPPSEFSTLNINKYWIEDVFHAYRERYPGATFESFGSRLIAAQVDRKIDLSRNDLVEAARDIKKSARSTVFRDLGFGRPAEYQFLTVRKDRR